MLDNFEPLTKIDGLEYYLNEPLSKHTTIKLGGPADILVLPKSIEQIQHVLEVCSQNSLNFTTLGYGSNVLISDNGIRGVVIKPKLTQLTTSDNSDLPATDIKLSGEVRLDQSSTKQHYSIEDLLYDESDQPTCRVEIGAGVFMPGAITSLINNGVTGLQWFSGIPGTLGGWIYNNVHGANKFIGDYVVKVNCVTPQGQLKTLSKDELQFDYDYSVFHTNKDIILNAELVLYKGDIDKAKYVAREWSNRKKVQPQRSAGCMWRNISIEKKQELRFESTGMGYVVDQKLGLSGYTVGKAKVSEKHAAFIETEEGATAHDVLQIMKHISHQVQLKYDITAIPEIFFLGFTIDELKGLTLN